MPTFIPYFTGRPLKKMVYSYNATTMTEKFGRTSKTVSITPEQHDRLDYLQADAWVEAGSIFGEAERCCNPADEFEDHRFY